VNADTLIFAANGATSIRENEIANCGGLT